MTEERQIFESVLSCDTENRMFELRREFNCKRAQTAFATRPTALPSYTKQGELAAGERSAINILVRICVQESIAILLEETLKTLIL